MELQDRPTGQPGGLRRQGDPQGGLVVAAGDHDVPDDEPRDEAVQLDFQVLQPPWLHAVEAAADANLEAVAERLAERLVLLVAPIWQR